MIEVKALTRDEMVALGWSGDAVLVDLWTGTEITIRGSVSKNYDHSDFQTRTTADTAKMKQIVGGTWTWSAPKGIRPGVLKHKDQLIAVAFHCFPHSIPVAAPADNIVNPVLTRATEKDANGNWRPGSHFCLYYRDTARLRKSPAGNWNDRMSNMAVEAVKLGNEFFGGGLYVVDTTKVLFENKEVEVVRILQEGTNYVRLRDLEKFGLKVDYDAARKLPVVKK